MKTQRQKKSQKRIIGGIIFAILLSFLSYSYAIASTSFSASNMKEKNSEITVLETDIAELEQQYLSLLDSLSLEDVQKYHLSPVQNIGFANQEKNTYTLSHL